MDSKELLGLIEAYKLVHTPHENIAEAMHKDEEDEEDEKEMKKGKKSKKEEEGEEDKDDEEDIKEATYSAKAARAGKDIGKPGKSFAKIAKSAAKRYGSKERGEKVAGAVLAKLRREETEVDVFDSILEYLISEGHASNNREAFKIMANLSEKEILEYRKLAAGLVGGMMALNMMKPGAAPTGIKRQAPEPDKTELVSKADKEKKDAEERRQADLYAQSRVDQARRTGLIK